MNAAWRNGEHLDVLMCTEISQHYAYSRIPSSQTHVSSTIYKSIQSRTISSLNADEIYRTRHSSANRTQHSTESHSYPNCFTNQEIRNATTPCPAHPDPALLLILSSNRTLTRGIRLKRQPLRKPSQQLLGILHDGRLSSAELFESSQRILLIATISTLP